MDGTISSNHPEISVSTAGYGDVLPFFAMSSTSNEWVSISTFESGHYHLEIYKCTSSCGTTSNWSKQKDVDGGTSSNAMSSEVFLLSTSSKVTVAYGLSGTVGAASFISTTDGGTTWSTAAMSSRSCNFDASGGAVIADTVHYACRYSGGVDYLNFPVAGSITGEKTVDSSCSACNPSVSTDGSSAVVVSYADQSSHVYHVASTDSGSSFGSVVTDATTESPITDRSYTSSPALSAGQFGGVWTAGTSSPFNVRFAFLPAVVTQPITATLSGGGSSPQTINVSGCSASPSTISGDGSPHNVVATPLCTMTLTFSSRYSWQGNGSSANVPTCSSGACPPWTSIMLSKVVLLMEGTAQWEATLSRWDTNLGTPEPTPF
jgi:hypothetical protein